ncbi:MAG: hypothetical protein GC180_10595 [Bacteroidetes bacterium]|nr:hypothetical protein [Bacteroidota bacterium]
MRTVFNLFKGILFLLIGLVPVDAISRSCDTSYLLQGKEHYYKIENAANRKLMIFLHGGVNNPYFKENQNQIELAVLLEGNESFVSMNAKYGLDVLVPITSDGLNWLDEPETAFDKIKQMIQSGEKRYEGIYLSGFSDGGTGSYKIFYSNPDYFDGLIVYNAYPQHKNFYKKVDYSQVKDKPVVFCGTYKYKRIPYEFLLTEYCGQKKYNPNTFMYLAKGAHQFNRYKASDFQQLLEILNGEVTNTSTDPIHGFVKNDQLITFYLFRKKIVRRYNFGKEVYMENLKQRKNYRKDRR